ncbi:MAG: hypothetical protein WDO68_04420 [Gammaproteobacteria bacterium]
MRSSTPSGILRALHSGLERVRGFFHRIAAVLPGVARLPAKQGERVRQDDFKLPEGLNAKPDKPAASETMSIVAAPEVTVSIEGAANPDVIIDLKLRAALKANPNEQIKRIQEAFAAADGAAGQSTQEGVPPFAAQQDLAGMRVVLRMASLSKQSQQQLVKGMSQQQLERVEGTRPKVGDVSGIYAATIRELKLRRNPSVQ